MTLMNLQNAYADDTEIDGTIVASSLTVTGPVTMSSVTVATTISASTGTIKYMVGTITNDAAPAGDIGESVESGFNTAIPDSAGSGSYQNIISIYLTAGDWDVSGWFTLYNNGATMSNASQVLSQIQAGSFYSYTGNSVIVPPTLDKVVSPFRVSLVAPATVYLQGAAWWTSGGPPDFIAGLLHARRMR